QTPESLYYQALGQSDRISKLITKGKASGTIRTTKDWSFCAERTYGENWFLVGEAAGFADPILSAGLTLTHTGARELAYTIIALDQGEHDAEWLKSSYDVNQRARVIQHIRFADFWYASNGLFTDLKDHCKAIARDAGLRLTSQGAWAWLARGGFANDFLGQAGIGGVDLSAIKQITRLFTAEDSEWTLNQYNVLSLNLDGATEGSVPSYHDGRIYPMPCYIRGEHRLALAGMYRVLVDLLAQTSDVGRIFTELRNVFSAQFSGTNLRFAVNHALQCLEVMLKEGWVSGKLDKKKQRLLVQTPERGQMIHDNIDEELNRKRNAARAAQPQAE
ncbi:MAG: hypothetical protein L0Y42_02395, partial [Phycisphaerales bacterium]|nr:hypothetical protein [Phycisphaerales bacterium]